MTNSQNFENLQLNRSINTIDQTSFPRHFTLHWHKYIEIIALPDHTDTAFLPEIRINQTTYKINPGDVLLIWPGELHEIINNSSNQIIGVQFAPTLLNELPDFAPYLNLFRTYRHIQQSLSPYLSQSLLINMERMLSIQKAQEDFCSVESIICLYEMFMEFGTYLKNNTLQNVSQTSTINSNTLEKINMQLHYGKL